MVRSESVDSGLVSWKVYKWWIVGGGWCRFIMFVASIAMASALNIVITWWISKWSERQFSNMTEGKYNAVNVSLLFGVTVMIALSGYLHSKLARKVGSYVFFGMLNNLLHRPMSFFDTTPAGQILNRFGKDTDDLDVRFHEELFNLLFLVTAQIGNMIYIGVMMPYSLILLVPTFTVFIFGLKNILRLIAVYERLIRTSLSPVLSSGVEAINGMVSYRAYDKFSYSQKLWVQRIDRQNNAKLGFNMARVVLLQWVQVATFSSFLCAAYIIPVSTYDGILPIDDKSALATCVC